MPFVHQVRRFAGAGSLGIVGFGAAASALVFVIHPASAQSALAAIQSAVTCAVTGNNACVSGTNTSSGIGVLGSSKTGLGVSGSAASNIGVNGASGSSYGVFGTSSSGKAGVAGTTANQSGVWGYTTAATGGVGVTGVSAGAYGDGLVGRDLTTHGTGVLGSVAKGTAVEADAGDGGSGFYAKVTGGATGVLVSAATGNGVTAQTAGAFGVHAVSTSAGGTGVYGATTSRGTGVFGDGRAGGGTGVYGSSTTSPGVVGESVGDMGVTGLSHRSDFTGFAGVHGEADNDADGVDGLAVFGTGVYGGSAAADGVDGVGVTGDGVYGESNTGFGVEATADQDVAIVGKSGVSNGADIYGPRIGVIGRANQSGAPFVATDQDGNTVFQVDGYGHVTAGGGYGTLARIGNGLGVKVFGPQSSAPTMEDTGTAQLVDGAAAVRLDPTFAQAIDKSSMYRVFLTPDGDTHGLYVASKTPAGFIVRESQGGRSSVAFDFRVVATALGQAGARMALVNTGNALARAPLRTTHHAARLKPPSARTLWRRVNVPSVRLAPVSP